MKCDYCDMLCDGFGCTFAPGKDYRPDRCIECLLQLIKDASSDLQEHFEEYEKLNG